MVTAAQPSEGSVLPAGVLVRGGTADIAHHFLSLAPLQPVRHVTEGLVCAPRAAPEAARAALRHCPLPWSALERVPGWPEPPSAAVSGWYLRGPDHAAPPADVRELVQVPGEGFGPMGHATTAMCLTQLAHMPNAPALDVGCGTGLLAQAWAAAGHGPALGYDIDGRAVVQARASVAVAGLQEHVSLHRRALETLDDDALKGRVLLANVPESAHHALLARTRGAPAAAVLSGVRPRQAAALLEAWHARGMSTVRTVVSGGFCALALRRVP